MIFSTSKKLLEAYRFCRGVYCGFGPVGCTPTCLRVRGTMMRSRQRRGKTIPAKFSVMLVVHRFKKERWTKHGRLK